MGDTKSLRLFIQHQLKGTYPDVPVADGVNMDELVAGDPDPMFLTLPIFQDGRVAVDGFRYTPQINQHFAQTMADRRVLGNMGHTPPYANGYQFDVPSAIWLGTMRDDQGVWWGKAYVMQGETRDFLRRLKATNGTIATSIDMRYDFAGVTILDDGTYTIDPSSAQLMQLDLAPDERAALQIEREMFLTRHMQTESESEPDMDLKDALAAMTVEQIDLLPDVIKQAVVAQHTPEPAPVEPQMQQMQQPDAQAFENFKLRVENAIYKLVPADNDAGILRNFVQLNVLTHMGTNFDAAAAVQYASEFVTSAEYQAMAKSVMLQMSGGPAIVPPQQPANSKTTGEQLEQNIDTLLGKWGLTHLAHK